MIYTNLKIDNIIQDIEKHLKNITNKKYIKDTLTTHLKYNMITKKEYNELMKKYNIKES